MYWDGLDGKEREARAAYRGYIQEGVNQKQRPDWWEGADSFARGVVSGCLRAET